MPLPAESARLRDDFVRDAAKRAKALPAPDSPALNNNPIDTDTYNSLFIQSDKEFFDDLDRILSNPLDPDVMGGQGPLYAPADGVWTQDDRDKLAAELQAWKNNADRIIVDNGYKCRQALLEVFLTEFFGSAPGLSLATVDAMTILKAAVFDGLSHIRYFAKVPGLMAVASLAVDILVSHLADVKAEEDLALKRSQFSDASVGSDEMSRAIDERMIGNTNKLFSHYQRWLYTHTPAELAKFRIPFTPSAASRPQIVASLQRAIAGAKREPVLVGPASVLQLLKLNGIDRGSRGGYVVVHLLLFPVLHFVTPAISRSDVRLGDRVLVYVMPDAVKAGAPRSPELGDRPGVVLVFDKTTSHATYDFSQRRWLTGTTEDVE